MAKVQLRALHKLSLPKQRTLNFTYLCYTKPVSLLMSIWSSFFYW